MTVPFAVVIEIPILLATFVSAFVMSKIERRSFGDYGLPLSGAFGRLFWQGVVWSMVIFSVVRRFTRQSRMPCLAVKRQRSQAWADRRPWARKELRTKPCKGKA
jgi:hypothetical protein